MQYPNSTRWTNYYFEKNVQGDVIGVYQKEGDGNSATHILAARYSYDPYGNPTSMTNGAGTAVSQTSNTIAAINPFRYRGYRYDGDTGLYYLQSRYYDPVSCRFVNADGYASTGQGQIGCNMFVYCNNNPGNYSDPTGNRAMGPSYMIVNDGGSSSTGTGSTSTSRNSSTAIVESLDSELMSHYSDATGGVDFGLCCAIGAAGAAEEVDIASLIGKLGTYNELRAEAAGTGLQVHHLIEKRFMAIEEIKEMFGTSGKMPSVIIDKDTHQMYTNSWRGAFPYGSNYGGMSTSTIIQFCQTEYSGCGGGNWLEFLSQWFN